MSRCYWILGLLVWGLTTSVRAETYTLTSGETITGEPLASSAKDTGVQVKVDEDRYQTIPWASFSQEDLKKLSKTPKFSPFVVPFIDVPSPPKARKTETPKFNPSPIPEPPAPQSLLGALFSSGLGVLVLLALYAANIYAGYEVAIFRARPPAIVAGLAAIPFLGFLATLIFLAMPTETAEQVEEAQPEAASGTPAIPLAHGADPLNPMQSDLAPHPAGLKLAHTDTEMEASPALPQTVTYQRGQFTFNRRFFETKFAGFFSVVRRDAERDMVLIIKSMRGEYIGQRITRIAANDLHLQAQRGAASEEIMIPFTEIQEIRLKHKDAP